MEKETVATQLHALFISKGLTLSLAESCTGGSLSATLTHIPGASKYFLGSVVAYSNQLKINMLNVKEENIKSQGAVSEVVAKQMAEGIRKLTGSDYSIAVSGIAGPTGGTKEKPVGTVWGAISQKKGSTQTKLYHFTGNRDQIIQQSVEQLLHELFILVKNSYEEV